MHYDLCRPCLLCQDPSFVEMPTPDQLAAFVASGQTWVQQHPSSVPTAVGLISAWNELDEGHWICATLPQYGGNDRLVAIGKVLRPMAVTLGGHNTLAEPLRT